MGLNLFLFGLTWKMKSHFSLDGEYLPVARDGDELRESESTYLESGLEEAFRVNKKMSMSSVHSVEVDRDKVRSISVA
jgi:hypothetical protein